MPAQLPIDHHLKFVGSAPSALPLGAWSVPAESRDLPLYVKYNWIGSPTMSFDPISGDNKAVYTLECRIEDMHEVIPNVLGYAEIGGANGTFLRTMPAGDPDFHGMIALRVVGCQYHLKSAWNPITGDVAPETVRQNVPTNKEFDETVLGNCSLQFLYARLQIEFGHTLYDLATDDAVAGDALGERLRYMVGYETQSLEYVQLPQAVLRWKTGPGAATSDPVITAGGGLPRVIEEIVLHWYRIPSLAMSTLLPLWRSMLNTVNDTDLSLPLTANSITLLPETALFLPFKTTLKNNPFGFREVEAELHWAVRDNGSSDTDPKGWNHYLYNDGSYQRVVWVDQALVETPVFEVDEHNLIFNAS